jgi:hypothetical protein
MKAKIRAWLVLLLLLGWGGFMAYRSDASGNWDGFWNGFVPGLIGVWLAIYAIKDSHDGSRTLKKELAAMRADRATEHQEHKEMLRALSHEMGRLEQALVMDEEELRQNA